jgi:hypothetical protein
MQLTPQRLEALMEGLPTQERGYFIEELKALLESDMPPYAKADTIGMAFLELENKIAWLNSQIKSLQSLKKRMEEAKELGKELTASTLQSYGIDKLEGGAISSLTLTPPRTKRKSRLLVHDPEKAMEFGYVRFEVDRKMLEEALTLPESARELEGIAELEVEEERIPSKVRVNLKRTTPMPRLETAA